MHFIRLIATISLGCLLHLSVFSQQIFYQDIFYGGVTAGGFSTGQGSGSGSFSLYIEPGSSIKQAYLFTYRIGYPPNVPITINGTPYLFDTTNILMQVNHKSPFASPVHLYYDDFTNSLNTNITSTFNVTIPSQLNLPINWGYWTIFIYITYENAALSKTATSLWINDKNFLGNEFYQYKNLMPINNSNPVSLSLYSDRTSDTIFSEGYNSYINANFIGTIGGFDSLSNGGVKGHFYYQNDTLFGLDDDTADSLMGGSDGLVDIKSYINNNDTSFDFQFTHQKYPNNLPTRTNINLLEIIAYTTPCDTFSTTATSLQDTICLDDSVQLTATGGATYSWFGAFGGLSDTTIANPIATPSQTTTYIVTIKNDSGCVKTEHVKIWVSPEPTPDNIVVTNNVCGDSIGSITVGNISNGNPPYSYTLTNLQTTNSNTQTTNTFNNLGTGIYEIQVSNANGCQWRDTVTITETNNAVANFTANPQSGIAPLDVTFNNVSNGANNFEWTVINSNGDTLAQHSTINTQHFFTEGGTYEVCLIAYNNQPQCTDTVCKTIFIDNNEEVSLFIPNVFTPNGDNENDNFILQIIGTEYLESLEVQVFNRWGQQMSNYELAIGNSISNLESPISNLTIWNGTTNAGAAASEGTYFYVISYTTKAGEIVTEKGTVSLLR